MPRITLTVRGGIPEKLKNEVEDVISDCQLQDTLFVMDIKSHSIELFVDGEQIAQVGYFINAVKIKFNLSIVKQGQFNHLGDYIVAFGKLQDGAVVKAMQDQAKGLFGK
ncbi:hypothetical protein AH04_152 [Erwinia phage AH04]|uniref:Uncharacterized protein n=1 Tax=Erwinia phage AH04 TaxID=2869569 RepID=A0AAE7X119_9CAUD|nr:hypothetical protein PQC02_gp162 [Erwinia phage AH04]QZA70628.1 hypothetical protein AH04_152 [Erwinia phage AH04]